MKEDKLLILADFLEFEVSKQPKYKFNMRIWADANFNPIECHTAACAAGWATLIFKELRLVQSWHPEQQMLVYDGQGGSHALAEFFDIPHDEVLGLFGADSAETPKQVANNIRKFVKHELT